MPLNSASYNAKHFKPTVIDNTTMGRKWIMKELVRSEYMCTEYPHVIIKFLPLGVIQIKGEKGQPYIHRYSLSHLPSGDWSISITPQLTNEMGEMDLKIKTNHLTLTPKGEGETLHLNKVNFKAYDNSK